MMQEPTLNRFYAAVFERTALLEGEVGGEGLLSSNGSPGATKATMFSFLDSQKAGYRGSRNSVWYWWMSVMASSTP